jgi:hypothetical protein
MVEMTIEQAKRLVLSDQRENSSMWDEEDASDEEVIAHVRNTLSLSDPAPIGAETVVEDGTEITRAYMLVLSEPFAD